MYLVAISKPQQETYADRLAKFSRLRERIYKFISPEPNSGCWLWVGPLYSEGYGYYQTYAPKKKYQAHRMLYELECAEIPHGKVIDHLCKNPTCCNPRHLEPVTPIENYRRGNGATASSAMKNTKTHCKNGHEFSLGNCLWHMRRGEKIRRCKICWNASQKKYKTKIMGL